MLVQLQYLRAIAALMVVYFHSVLQAGKVNPDFDWQPHLFGETGVDIFFVLSGFVMWLTTSGRQIRPLEFYRRRIARIVPLYWLATLFSAAVALVAPSLLKTTVFNLPHLIASLFFIPWHNPADPTTITPVVIPGWTLNYEMFFYLIFGALLFIRESWRLPMLAATLIGIVILCRLFPISTTATLFYSQPIMFEFLAGVVVGKLYCKRVLLPQAAAWPLLVAGFGFLLLNEGLGSEAMRFLFWGIPALFIVYSVVSIDFSRVPSIRWLAYLGDASYAIYITHAFSLALLRVVLNHVPLDFFRQGAVFIPACLIVSVIGGSIVHELTTPRRRKKHMATAI